MDPSIYLQYSPPSGLPQESKLATYMNRSTSTPTRSLNQALGKLSLESSPTSIRKMDGHGVGQVMIGEFVPITYYPPPNIIPDSPDNSPPTVMVGIATNQVHQENVGGTTYFYSTNSDSLNSTGGLNSSSSMEACMGPPVVSVTPSPYATQMYSVPPPLMGPMTSKPGLAASFYMPETIRSEIYYRNNEELHQGANVPYPDLPENVEMYSDLSPLESNTTHSMASSFRATHRHSGDHYALRRLHGCSGGGSGCKRLEAWKQVDHPNIVRLHETFVTTAFGDHSTIMVYDYHPGCGTLMQKYLATGAGASGGEPNGYHDPFSSDPDAPRPYTHQKNAMLRAVACGSLLPEAVLWSLLVQLTAGLRAVHSAGLACRSLDPTKVVMNGCRVRISWCGITDAIHPNSNIDIGQAQQEDLTALGRLTLALACRSMHCDNLAASMDLVARTYSTDFQNLILYLLTPTPARRSVTDLMPMIGARFYTQVEALERRTDAFEDQLAREIDNGRLLRILIKLGVINERPDANMDTAWSETGDRYMLKLFRDYLFHAVTEDGRPWLDQAHLSHCLNQLDTGSQNKVELMSRNQQSVLVVSYAELKHCLETAFDEIMQAAASPT